MLRRWSAFRSHESSKRKRSDTKYWKMPESHEPVGLFEIIITCLPRFDRRRARRSLEKPTQPGNSARRRGAADRHHGARRRNGRLALIEADALASSTLATDSSIKLLSRRPFRRDDQNPDHFRWQI